MFALTQGNLAGLGQLEPGRSEAGARVATVAPGLLF